MTAKNEKTRKKNVSDDEGIWVFVNVLKWKCLKTTKQMEGRNHSLIQYKYMNVYIYIELYEKFILKIGEWARRLDVKG